MSEMKQDIEQLRLPGNGYFLYLITDSEGRIRYASPVTRKWLSQSGWANAAWFPDSLSDDDRTNYFSLLSKCASAPGEVLIQQLTHTGTGIGPAGQPVTWQICLQEGNREKLVEHTGQVQPVIANDTTNGKHLTDYPLSLQQLKSLVSHIPGAIYRCRGDAYFTLEFFSDEIEKISGYPTSYFLQNRQRGYSSLIHQEDWPRVKKAIQNALDHKEKYEIEYRIIRKDGTIAWVEESGKGVYDEADQVNYVDGCLFDVTHKHQTESELIASKKEIRQLALVAKNTTNSVMIADSEQNITWINEGYTRVSGYTLEEIRGRKIGYSLESSANDPALIARVRKALNERQPYKETLVSKIHNGEEIWLEVDCHPLWDDNGEFIGYMSIENDVTQGMVIRREQEELLQRLTLATDSAGIAIFEIDLATNQVIWDDRMYALYGIEKGYPLSLYKVFGNALHPEDEPMMRRIIEELLTMKKEINGAVYRIMLPDGSLRYIESHAIIQKSSDGKVRRLIGTNRNITDSVLVQERLRQQNKVLRDIAFIQSHEVRKPLANILGIIEILQTSGAMDGLEIFEHLVESAKELDQQIRQIVQQSNMMDDDIFR